MNTPPIDVAVVAISAQLGGTERVLLDLAHHAGAQRLRLHVLLPTDGPLRPALEATGAAVEIVPGPNGMLEGSQRGFGLLRTAPATLRRLRHWGDTLAAHPRVRGAALVYSVGFKPHLAAARCPRPRVWHIHEFPPHLTGWIWRRLGRRMAAAIAFNSEAVARAWYGAAVEARSPTSTPVLRVAGNGVDLEHFRPIPPSGWIHRQLGIPAGARLLGMPAVLARWKGQLAVLEAFRGVREDFPDAHLVFVGSGIYDTGDERRHGARLERALQDAAGAGGRVHLLPFQPEIERVYPEFLATLHYSLRPEPFGRVVVESMACGIPVIAAGEGGPQEILGPRPEGGWLVRPRNPPALAEALRRVLGASPESLAEAGSAARRLAERRFPAGRFAADLAALLHSVAGPPA